MEDSKTKYIESSLAAFRAIKSFVFLKGIYPRNFNTGFWDEEDYKDPDLRLSMRNEFEQYLEMLASVHNNYVKVLYDTMPHIESEYNNLVINSRNLEQAVKLFKEKYEEAMIVIEYEMDVNQLLLRYLAPLKKHAIITEKEGDTYQEIICNIGIVYNNVVNVVCKVFDLELPWNHVNSNTKQITHHRTDTHDSSAQNTEDFDDSCSDGEDNGNQNNMNHYLSSRVSFKPVGDKGPDLDSLYRFLTNEKVICAMDQKTFEDCVSHAYFSPLYLEGNKVNILYTISQLKCYYENQWLDAVCEDLGVSRKRITQRPPSEDFRKGFPTLKLQK